MGNMDSATLRQRHRAAVGRYFRAMVDGDGDVPAGLLDELGGIAEEHSAGDKPEPRVRPKVARRAEADE